MNSNSMKYIKLTLLLLFSILLLTACGSGTSGDSDLCPEDPNKTDPGICGCGKLDTDDNSNSIIDCNEKFIADITGTCDDTIDSDNDSIPDCSDTCDDTIDSDGDGKSDCIDTCDDRIDTDGDGTPDCLDTCEDSSDTDGDGIPDCNDTCDDTIDSDGDGSPDCIDTCDDTIDTDGDSIPDCIDTCDDTIDTDGDGVVDCIEPHYVAVGDNGTIVASIDGINWGLATSGTGETIHDIASGSWIGVGRTADPDNKGVIGRVDDYFNMTTVELDPGQELKGIANNGNGVWIAVGFDEPTYKPMIVKTGDDGASWSTELLDTVADFIEIATDNNSNWIAVGQGIGSAVVSTSNDNGINWDTNFLPTAMLLNGIAYHDNGTIQRWITVGDAGTIAVTDNIGTDWTDKSLTGVDDLTDIAHNGSSNWVAVGVDSTIAVSSDNGDTWSSFAIDIGAGGTDFIGVVYGNGLWVAVGMDGTLYYSNNNGIEGSWVAVTGVTVENLRSVAYNQ